MSETPDIVEAERRAWADGEIEVDPPSELALEAAGAVRSEAPEGDNVDISAHQEAFESRGVVASAAVVAREGISDDLTDPQGAVGLALGEDGLGASFDALVATGAFEKVDLLATAVERSHEYYGVPTVLASGEAREWAVRLSDDAVEEMYYHDAPSTFEAAQANAVVASARAYLRAKVLGG